MENNGLFKGSFKFLKTISRKSETSYARRMLNTIEQTNSITLSKILKHRHGGYRGYLICISKRLACEFADSLRKDLLLQLKKQYLTRVSETAFSSTRGILFKYFFVIYSFTLNPIVFLNMCAVEYEPVPILFPS